MGGEEDCVIVASMKGNGSAGRVRCGRRCGVVAGGDGGSESSLREGIMQGRFIRALQNTEVDFLVLCAGRFSCHWCSVRVECLWWGGNFVWRNV